jgi:hypothetical protein
MSGNTDPALILLDSVDDQTAAAGQMQSRAIIIHSDIRVAALSTILPTITLTQSKYEVISIKFNRAFTQC